MSCMQRSTLAAQRKPSQLEIELEEAAQARNKTVPELLEEIVREWLDRHQEPKEADEARQEQDLSAQMTDEERQHQLHAIAERFIGIIEGDDPDRAQNASSRVREKLLRRHAR
jgi:cobalamin biosynthesis Mg chelatase CobN